LSNVLQKDEYVNITAFGFAAGQELSAQHFFTPHYVQMYVLGGEYAMIQLKRVYDPPNSADGARFLVERLWPRGVKKSSLAIDTWLKDASPSVNLRKWFHHDPAL
jgi:hypothetical protein